MEFQKISIPPPPPPPPKKRRKKKIKRKGGGGGGSESFFRGAPSKIDEQTNSYFTVNRCSKAKINVFIDDLLLAVG